MSDRRTEIAARLGVLEGERATLLAELIALNLYREPDDRLLTVEDAASMLSVSVDWLYRHANEFSFTVRPGPGQVRFSSIGIQDYLREERE